MSNRRKKNISPEIRVLGLEGVHQRVERGHGDPLLAGQLLPPLGRPGRDLAAQPAPGVAALEPGDVLLIAGKGHESGQIVGDRVLPFDDASEVRAAIAALGGAAA